MNRFEISHPYRDVKDPTLSTADMFRGEKRKYNEKKHKAKEKAAKASEQQAKSSQEAAAGPRRGRQCLCKKMSLLKSTKSPAEENPIVSAPKKKQETKRIVHHRAKHSPSVEAPIGHS